MISWFAKNSSAQTHTVGQKVANDAGLYDMAGNVAEICWGAHNFNHICVLVLGGSYDRSEKYLRIDEGRYLAKSGEAYADIGLRVVRSGKVLLAAAARKQQQTERMLPQRKARFEEVLQRWDMVDVVRPGESITFDMGSSRVRADDFEKPSHKVTWNKPFRMSRYELTIGDFVDIINYAYLLGLVHVWKPADGGDVFAVFFDCGDNLYHGIRKADLTNDPLDGFEWNKAGRKMIQPEHPLENVMPLEWYSGTHLCNLLSELIGYEPFYVFKPNSKSWAVYEPVIDIDVNADGFRYPFEAEWELAARGGRNPSRSRYAGSNRFSDVTMSEDEIGRPGYRRQHYQHWDWEAGAFTPNSLGIHDMSGTLGEWVGDKMHRYPDTAVTNPISWIWKDFRPLELKYDGYTDLRPHRRDIINDNLIRGAHLEGYDRDEKKLRQITTRLGDPWQDFGSLRPVRR